MNDPTEVARRVAVAVINTAVGAVAEVTGDDAARKMLEKDYGTVYNTAELSDAFEVISFLAPYVLVKRKSDGQRGTLMFSHRPRFYFCFEPE